MAARARRRPARRLVPPGLVIAGLVSLLSACGGVAAQVDRVGCPQAGSGFSGRVVDAKTRKPISGAQVRTDPRTEIAQTGTNGCFLITVDVRAEDKAIAPDRYRLEFELRDGDLAIAGRPTTIVFAPRDSDPVDYAGDAVSLGIIQVARAPRPEDDTITRRPDPDYSQSITVPAE